MISVRELFLIPMIFLSVILTAEIVIYPVPEGVEASAQYRVEVLQKEKKGAPFVYVTHAQLPDFNLSETTSFCAFSFTGKVTVRVTKLQGTFKSCKILPSSYGIEPVQEKNSVTFELDRPRKVSLEFDGDITHPMLVFADAPEKSAPSPEDPNVIYFGPGMHEVEGDVIAPEAGQTVYLAGGAVVTAFIRGRDVPNVKIRGRGILSGRKYGHTHGRHILFHGEASSDILVEDIIVVDSPGFYVTTGGPRTHIRNVKGIGWWFNTDGFSTGSDGLIEDCFLKCNDDAIKLYRSGTKVFRTTIWQMENGAPFQISWNMTGDQSGFVVRDCDVIRCDHRWDNTNTAVFNAIHGGSGHMRDYLFEDIRIENCDWRLFSIQIRFNKFARSETLGNISDVVFRNVSCNTPEGRPMKRLNLLQGYDSASRVTNFTFENLSINGRLIHDAEQGRFEIEPKTTENIRFAVTKPSRTSETISHALPEVMRWSNPVTNGLNSYGQKDFHIIRDGDTWYLTATEQPNPEWGKRGCILYASEDLLRWREEKYLFNIRSIDADAWYRDAWAAPEIHKIRGQFYLTFNGRNNQHRAYKKTGFGIAVANEITGPYTVLNPAQPLSYGNNATIFEDRNGQVYAYWDLDGRIYGAALDLKSAAFRSEPKEILGPATLDAHFRYLDAPFVMRRGKTCIMLFSQFYTGYVERVQYCTAPSPLGPWTWAENNPLMEFLESEADEVLKMPYSKGYTFAPPTQVVFNNQVFQGPGKTWFIAYHSSEKYSEPYLIIEPAEFDKKGLIVLPSHKAVNQRVLLK